MSAIGAKPKSNDGGQLELGNRLNAAQILCAQVGETPASFVDWLTNEGGLKKMVLLYFTKHLAVQNPAVGIARLPGQAAPTAWLIEENSVYRLNEQGHHCDEITVVPRETPGIAKGRIELARSSAFAAGPAAADALVGWLGAPATYVIATTFSILAVFWLRGLIEPARPAIVRRHVLHDLCDGAAFVLSHPMLRPMLWTSVIFNISWFILQSVYVLYPVHALELSASGVGITLGIYGAGMVVGAVITPALSKRLPFGTMLVLGLLSGFVGAIVMTITIPIHSPLLAGISFFFFGVGLIIWTITSITLRQAITPDNMLGRASAFLMMATFGARPVGAAIGALIGSVYGVNACIAAAAVGFFVQLMTISSSSISRLSNLPVTARVWSRPRNDNCAI